MQPNTVEKNGEISLVTYSSDVSGVIQSFVERYEKSAVEDLYACWKDDQKWF